MIQKIAKKSRKKTHFFFGRIFILSFASGRRGLLGRAEASMNGSSCPNYRIYCCCAVLASSVYCRLFCVIYICCWCVCGCETSSPQRRWVFCPEPSGGGCSALPGRRVEGRRTTAFEKAIRSLLSSRCFFFYDMDINSLSHDGQNGLFLLFEDVVPW